MHTLLVSVPFTTRKNVHKLVDPSGEVIWTEQNFGKMMQHLHDADIFEAEIHHNGCRWRLSLHPLPL